MMTGGEGFMKNITVESCPSDTIVPPWIIDSIAKGRDDLLVVYPNEATRLSSIQSILSKSGHVDSSRHTTLQRLVKALSIDLRLPVIIPSTATGLIQVHDKFADAARNHRFPRLHPDVARPWTLSKSERLLRLHAYVTKNRILSKWKDDPGALEAERIVSTFETNGLLHEHKVIAYLCDALSDQQRSIPYTMGTINGIILLNHPPDFTESEKRLLEAIALRRPIHHLCSTGSFRLGFHGAYINDEIVHIQDETQLPEWVPSHVVWSALHNKDNYTTDGIHLFSFDRASQIFDAAISAIELFKKHSNGTVLLIDADEHRHTEWARRLQQIGITCDVQANAVGSTSAVQAILRFLSISYGQDAWSAAKLFDIAQAQAFPINENLFSDLKHPVHEEWRPRPHLDVIENIGRSFHVLGGKGALQRWLGSLSVAQPYATEAFRRREQERAIEETHWWLQCLATTWSALLDKSEQNLLVGDFIGISSQASLPLPEPSKSPRDVLTKLLLACNWEKMFERIQNYDASVGALQAWVQAVDALLRHAPNVEFLELCRLASQQTKAPMRRINHFDVHVCTPNGAYGVSSDLTLFAGVDAESWSMKPERVPWVDDSVRMELGLADGDLPIRKARHLFKSLLNSSQQSILFDTEHDESVGNSTPLVEYLSMVELDGDLGKLSEIPEFIEKNVSDGAGWSIVTRENGNWLTYRTSSLSISNGEVKLDRVKHRQRDRQQQAGLELRAFRPPTVEVQSLISIANRFERDIHVDRFRRQPKFKPLENGATMGWEIRDNLLTTTNLIIQPTVSQANVRGGRTATSYPHLGFKKNGISRGPSLDPRPLPPPDFTSKSLNQILSSPTDEDEAKVWSTSRLNPWFVCPRQAWTEQVLGATEHAPEPSEDIAPLMKGTLVHSIEEYLMTLMGIEIGGPSLENGLPMHRSVSLSNQEIWEGLLRQLAELAPWLVRTNAVSVHRCNDLIGCSPEQWRNWLEGDGELALGGRLGRLLLADLGLTSAAPIACEWSLQKEGKSYIEIEGFDDELNSSVLNLRGRIDRVDCLVLDGKVTEQLEKRGLYKEGATQIPLYFDGDGPAAKRFIIIRDIKTIEGPRPGERGIRHTSGLFKETQLALYARAWELAHPGDRVIGVGISEVGDDTYHMVELDPSFSFLDPEHLIGIRTSYSENHFRMPNENQSPQSNSFRAWMSSRITGAIRARNASRLGWNHPTPGTHCSYCPLANACSSASIGGEIK